MSYSASSSRPYSRYAGTAPAPRPASTSTYHRHRYGRHGRTPRPQEPGAGHPEPQSN